MSVELLNMDCQQYMAGMEANSVDAIITDPPYFRVKGEAWDNQWESAGKFIEWVGELCVEFERILKPNGSLYFFASPQMAARVEVKLAERFNVLSSITWRKGSAGKSSVGWSQKTEKEALRMWLPETERVIFAEHYGSDRCAANESGYELQCQEAMRQVFQIGPLCESLGVSRASIAALIVADYKNMESAKAQASNWILGKNMPNAVDFARLKTIIPITGEYEDLRREYEDLRRPFNVTAKDQWSDVWDFDPVGAYPGKHPCEKPQPLLAHILNASTKPGAIVFDPFAGSGSMGIACLTLGRQFIGTELCPDNYAKAKRRLDAHKAQQTLFQPDDYDLVSRSEFMQGEMY